MLHCIPVLPTEDHQHVLLVLMLHGEPGFKDGALDSLVRPQLRIAATEALVDVLASPLEEGTLLALSQ